LETLLLLVVIAAVAAVFVWLGRSLGDAWPPVVSPDGAAEAPPAGRAAADAPPVVAAVVAPLPEEEFALPAVSTPAAASVAAPPSPAGLRAPVAVSARPRPAITLPEGAALRRVAWALLAGGGLLLALSLWAGRVVPPGQRLPGFLLTLIGGLAALLGLQTLARGQVAGWFGRPLVRLANLLRITPAQAVLLLLALPFAWLTRQASGNGLLAYSATVAILAWLVAVGLAVAGSLTPRAEHPAEARRPVVGLDRWDIVLSVGLFVLALALRAYATGRYPTTYSGDEGSAGLYAVELLTGKANNLFGLGWFSFPALYFTVQSAAIALFGQTVEAVRLTSAVAGALTVVALYWLGRAMFNRTTALLAALFLKDRITPARAAGLAFIVAGDLLVGGTSLQRAFEGGVVWKGDLLFMAAAACWSVYSVTTSRLSDRLSGATSLATTFSLGLPLLLAFCAPEMARQDYAGVSFLGWAILVLSAVFPLYVCFRLWASALATLGVAATTRFSVLVPVVAGVSSAVWTGERFSGAKVASAGVVLLGLALARLGGRSGEREPS